MSTTIRLEKRALEKITRFAEKRYLDRGTYMRQLLMKQLEEENLDESIQNYLDKKITIEEVAKRNNLSLLELFDIFKKRNISLNVSLEDIEASVEI